MTFDSSTTYYTKARQGEAFVVSEVYNVASGGTQNIHIENPDGSGARFWVMDLTVTSDGPYQANVHDSFSSQPSGGTAVEIENVLLDAEGATDDDGHANANEGVSFTASQSHAVGVGGGGSGGVSQGFTTTHPPVVIEEGREIVLEVENTGTDPNNYGLTIVYYETPMNA